MAVNHQVTGSSPVSRATCIAYRCKETLPKGFWLGEVGPYCLVHWAEAVNRQKEFKKRRGGLWRRILAIFS